jgi:hypothetical protein
MRPADPAWRLETLLAGQAQDARLGGADAGEAQSCLDFPAALTMQGAVGQQLMDGFDQGLVRHLARAEPTPRGGRRIGDGDTARAQCLAALARGGPECGGGLFARRSG